MSSDRDSADELVMYLYRLKEGAGAEYDRRHANVWPEMLAKLEECGVYDYEIWRRNELVVCRMRTKSGYQSTTRALQDTEVQKLWSASLMDLFDQIADAAGQPLWLHQVFEA